MKKLGYGKAYRYDHDEPGAFARGQTYFPDEMGEKQYYHPVERLGNQNCRKTFMFIS